MSISELYRTGGLYPSAGTAPVTEAKKSVPGGSEFQKLLDQQASPVPSADSPKNLATRAPLQISSHAQTRIRSREIPWSEALEERISNGVDAAHSKGSREALILADNVAVIANVKSRTIITAMDRTQLKEKVFTNIDSAVLV